MNKKIDDIAKLLHKRHEEEPRAELENLQTVYKADENGGFTITNDGKNAFGVPYEVEAEKAHMEYSAPWAHHVDTEAHDLAPFAWSHYVGDAFGHPYSTPGYHVLTEGAHWHPEYAV